MEINPDKIKQYSILSSSQITHELHNLASTYPTLVTLKTSQEEFGLSKAGTSSDCTFNNKYDTHDNEGGEGCFNYYLTIEDTVTHNSTSSQTLPEVFLSGAVHGNERVGPTAVLEAAKILLEATYCEAIPHIIPSHIDINTEEGAEWLLQIEQGKDCRKELYDKGISDYQRQWLARLVTTRRIVIIPTANALGYDRNQREEVDIDPNRDFPFDVLDETQCMQTIAGRTINELFRIHMFQIALTFHGGTEVVSYEWGAPTYKHVRSPDDLAQVEIGDGYARFAGDFQGTDQYVSGTMNDLVYPVRGGMEDWAYAGSWDPDRVIQCKPNPNLYGTYNPEKTTYNQSQLRAFNMLIETSNSKIPTSHLGTSKGLLDYRPSYDSNGHIARNIRLALMAVDIVEPYVSIRSVNGVPLSDDIVPMSDRAGLGCKTSKIMAVPSTSDSITLSWTVGGGFTVDSTNIYFANWDDIHSSIDCSTHLLDEELGSYFQSTHKLTGITRWHKNVEEVEGSTFSASIDISKYRPGDKIAVFATARLDQSWTGKPTKYNIGPDLPPMSHLVNTRTDYNWLHENEGKLIKGRKDWFSMPLTVQLLEDATEIVDLSNRFTLPSIDVDDTTDNIFANGQKRVERSSDWLLKPFGLLVFSLFMTFVLYRTVKRYAFTRSYMYTAKKDMSMEYEENDNLNDIELSINKEIV